MKTPRQYLSNRFPDYDKVRGTTGHDDIFMEKMMLDYAESYHQEKQKAEQSQEPERPVMTAEEMLKVILERTAFISGLLQGMNSFIHNKNKQL